VRIVRVLGVLEPGGAQLSVLRLARAQTALGVTTRLLAGDATPQGIALARHFGFEVDALHVYDDIVDSPRQWSPDPLFARWLAGHVGGADLVHAHMFGAWWAASRAVPPGLPLVASEHNALSWPLGDHTGAAADASGRVDQFFVHGPGPHADIRDLGVDPARLAPGRSAIAVHTTARPGLVSPRLTFTGRLRADKGPDLLLHALALMREPPVTYLVGDGPMHREVRHLVDELGLRRKVKMPGWSQEPARYVVGSAVHVVPSREETWSQSAVTALALGVPVVATAVEGLPVTLADRRGLLVAPDPASLAAGIQRVLDGTAGLDADAGRRYAALFQPAQIAAYYFEAYQQLVRRRVPA
jgi:glycosyltransferase involved in cell wall biosynthesis